ncbi:MAG: hypothetical protein HY514_02045 [Candidatus Aenigmarchaeota archaeon]|nr:hypothetical protein [Candidatus Aenigmarchaeota archaeon]
MYSVYPASYQRKLGTYATYRKFSIKNASVPFFASYPGYPSYLGVNIFQADEKYMGKSLLGFTNGNFIVIRKGLNKILRLFVQFHEEEHVKDMSASEKDVDKRALKRLMQRNMPQKELREVKKLLKQRWQTLNDFSECGLRHSCTGV